MGFVDSLVTSGVNAAASAGMLERQLDFEREMYEREYNDNIAFYQMQLADSRENTADERSYNSPAAQSARLKAAGINPQISGLSDASSSPAASTPAGSKIAPNRQVNMGSFIPQIALNFESIIDTMKSAEELKALKLQNRASEVEIIDDLIPQIFTSDEVDGILSKFPEIDTSSSGLRKFYKSLGKDSVHGGELNSAVVSADYDPRSTIVNKVRNALFGVVPNSQRKRLEKLAIQRIGSMARKSQFEEDSYKYRSNKSRPSLDSLEDLFQSELDTLIRTNFLNTRAGELSLDKMEKESNKAATYDELWKVLRDWVTVDDNNRKWGDGAKRTSALIALVLMEALGSGMIGGRLGSPFGSHVTF